MFCIPVVVHLHGYSLFMQFTVPNLTQNTHHRLRAVHTCNFDNSQGYLTLMAFTTQHGRGIWTSGASVSSQKTHSKRMLYETSLNCIELQLQIEGQSGFENLEQQPCTYNITLFYNTFLDLAVISSSMCRPVFPTQIKDAKTL